MQGIDRAVQKACSLTGAEREQAGRRLQEHLASLINDETPPMSDDEIQAEVKAARAEMARAAAGRR